METQFYGDGQHNGGVYFWGNNNPYIYTYQNPIRYIDPNGKQTDTSEKRGFIPNQPLRYTPLTPQTPAPVVEPAPAPGFWRAAAAAIGTRLISTIPLFIPGTLNAPQPKFNPYNVPTDNPSDDNQGDTFLYRGIRCAL